MKMTLAATAVLFALSTPANAGTSFGHPTGTGGIAARPAQTGIATDDHWSDAPPMLAGTRGSSLASAANRHPAGGTHARSADVSADSFLAGVWERIRSLFVGLLS